MDQVSVQYLPLEKLVCEPQVRDCQATEQEIIGLARSIQECGLLQPIVARVEGEKFVVVDGERRLSALRLIPSAKSIPTIVSEKKLNPAEVVQRQLVANCQRKELRPLERARGIKRLMEATGWPAKEAAGKLGLSTSMVSKLLALLSLPNSIQEQVEAGAIPATAAYQLSRVAELTQQAALAEQLAGGQIDRDEISTSANCDEEQRSGTRRAKAALGGGVSVTVVAENLGLERFIEVLERVLVKAKQARARGIELAALCRQFREASKA